MTQEEIKDRLAYLKQLIIDEVISYGEIVELQSLAKYIDPSDTQLLEWAGVEEKGKEMNNIEIRDSFTGEEMTVIQTELELHQVKTALELYTKEVEGLTNMEDFISYLQENYEEETDYLDIAGELSF